MKGSQMKHHDDITVGNEPVAQGEFRIRRIEALPDEGLAPFTARHGDSILIGHSEQGHHHLLSGDCEVLEQPDPTTPGMIILYAIVRDPGARLHQSATDAHGAYFLPPGLYKITDDQEYDVFTDQVRRVTD